MIIGITGGTGSGKTTLLDMIRRQGGLVLDCDAIYHHLLETDTALLTAIDRQFPGCVENGTLDRKKLGAIVFADPQALEQLNAITHKAIRQAVENALADAPQLVAIDAIALFESRLDQLCSVTVAITAPEDLRIHRLMARDGITAQYAKARIAAQKPDSWFREKCDYCLENSSDFQGFQEKCLDFLQNLGIMKE